jgi:hypothetical protein
MSSFANLKRNRSDIKTLTKAIEATSQPAEAGSKDDTRFWQPEVDKAGNGMAVIRFFLLLRLMVTMLYLGFVHSVTAFRDLVVGSLITVSQLLMRNAQFVNITTHYGTLALKPTKKLLVNKNAS